MATDYRAIENRYDDETHLFKHDVMMASLQLLFLDFFDAHARLHGRDSVSEQNASIISRFMALLEEGHYVKHREVGYYAERLFVTPKHLSEVCKEVSGRAANYWINRFTTIHIRRLLRAHDMSFTQISDLFEFSSQAYFSRFVQKNLGMPPSAVRE